MPLRRLQQSALLLFAALLCLPVIAVDHTVVAGRMVYDRVRDGTPPVP